MHNVLRSTALPSTIHLFNCPCVLCFFSSCSLVFCKPPKQQLSRGRGGFNRGNNPFDTPSVTGDNDIDSDDYLEVSSITPSKVASGESGTSSAEETTAGTVETTRATAATMSALATTEDAIESSTSLTDAAEGEAEDEEERGELAPTTEWAAPTASESTQEEVHGESVYYTC